ncbi:GNAT family N-acetyltransferase [Beduini massiliensis]|uniref:GNAT family N-acetyltransferase n=1 Tax=Beduini massiliensis TaxID=1585974 RepID=UPI0006936803|nr:GNAT family N-acetyltransferase [Beduini massiliensis]
MKKIDYNDIEEIRSYIEKYGYNEYNCNIVTLLMWKDVYELYYEIHEHFFVGYWLYHDRIRWMMPLCDEAHFKEAVDFMLEYSKQHEIEFVVEAAVEPFVELLKKYYPKNTFIWRLEENAGDYVYDVSMHATLKGKKMQKRRNHYNAFIKEYEGRFKFIPYQNYMQEEVLRFLNQWKDSHDRKEDIEAEINGIGGLLAHYDELNLLGGCLYIDGKIEAFTLASRLYKDTLQIHVEKANRSIRGLYVAVLKHFLNEHLDYHFINREDDLGLPELRKAKMDLHPLYRLNKYAIGLNQTKLIRPDDQYTAQIKQLWLDCFADENETSTDFYFNHLYNPTYTYAIECYGQILAAMQIKPMTLKIGDKDVDTHFIVGVCTKRNFRGNGFMRTMMNQALNDHKEDQLLILQAYNWDIYHSFDFHETYYHKKAVIKQPFENIDNVVYNFKKEVRAESLLKSYQSFTKAYTGYRIRDIDYYQNYFIPYHQNEGHFILNIYKEETCIGYLVYEKSNDSILIHEAIIGDQSGLKAVLNDLLCEVKQIEIRMADNIELIDNEITLANMAVRCQDDGLKTEIEKLTSTLFISEIL